MSKHQEIKSSQQWCRYFIVNAASVRRIPWEQGARLTERERRSVAKSVQTFQLGESGEGRHLFRVAREWATANNDPDYLTALHLFVGEEHRHAADLGRFLDLADIPRLPRQWADGVFRWLRHRAGLELTISVLVTAEIIAKVYYRALRNATTSIVLKRLCEQILRDEVAHVRFQCERIALLRRNCSRFALCLRRSGQRLLMAGTCLAVWWTHGSTLRAGGFRFRRFWHAVHRELAQGLRRMEPHARLPEPQLNLSRSEEQSFEPVSIL